jgi:hypothetical protein
MNVRRNKLFSGKAIHFAHVQHKQRKCFKSSLSLKYRAVFLQDCPQLWYWQVRPL